jgi:excisionase family DNA binding protein
MHDATHRAYTIDEFGERYGPKRTLTYRLIKEHKLIAVRAGSKTLIRHDDAESWLASLKEVA